jgi:hypothetical protein
MNMRYAGTVALLMTLLSSAYGWAKPAEQGLTLLVVPERYNLIQVSFDVIAKRPVALVSYRVAPDSDEVVLHAWTGNEWVPVTLEDYASGKFLIMKPNRIVLVGDDEHLPEQLVEKSNWGPIPLSINTMDPAEMLNALGPMLAFSASEWRWFASRYKMELENVTAKKERVSWYDQMTRARRRQAPPPTDIPPADVVPVPVVIVDDEPVDGMEETEPGDDVEAQPVWEDDGEMDRDEETAEPEPAVTDELMDEASEEEELPVADDFEVTEDVPEAAEEPVLAPDADVQPDSSTIK